MPESRTPGRSVTSKILAILAVYESTTTPQTLTQLAEAADVSMSTAFRLVGELVEWGALVRDENGRYLVGLRLWQVAQGGGRDLRETARPFLQDLFSFTEETSHLAVRVGDEALYVDRVYSSKRVPRASRVGGRLPLHATAVGKVLLAYEEPWLRDAYLTRRLEAPTLRTHVNPDRLREELARVRKIGFATTFEEVRAGASSIAVPVPADDGRAQAAIGLVMPATQAPQMERYLPVLRGVASQVARAVALGLPALRLVGIRR